MADILRIDGEPAPEIHSIGRLGPAPLQHPAVLGSRPAKARSLRQYKTFQEAYPYGPAEAVTDLDGRGGAA